MRALNPHARYQHIRMWSQVLADIVGLLEEKKVFLALAGVHTKVMKVMQLHGLFEKLGPCFSVQV